MKVAKARYVGRKGDHTRRLPDGSRIRFRQRNRADPWVDIEDPDAAEYIAGLRNYEVEWTARGQLLAYGRDILDKGYQKKRSLASELDISFDGQPAEEEVDEQIEEMIETMEQQRR